MFHGENVCPTISLPGIKMEEILHNCIDKSYKPLPIGLTHSILWVPLKPRFTKKG